jgi:hypothetical protein
MSGDIATMVSTVVLGAVAVLILVAMAWVFLGTVPQAAPSDTAQRLRRIRELEHDLDLLPCSDDTCHLCRVRAVTGDPRQAVASLALGHGLLSIDDIRRLMPNR